MFKRLGWLAYGLGFAALVVATLVMQFKGHDVVWLWCIAAVWLLSIVWEVTARI